MLKLIGAALVALGGVFVGLVWGLTEDRCDTCSNERVVFHAPAQGNVEVRRCPDCRDGEVLAVTTMKPDQAGAVPAL